MESEWKSYYRCSQTSTDPLIVEMPDLQLPSCYACSLIITSAPYKGLEGMLSPAIICAAALEDIDKSELAANRIDQDGEFYLQEIIE